jgi:hypothetical protein
MSTRHQQAATYVRDNPRKSGSFLLLVGAFGVYQGIVKPMQEATEGANTVSMSENLAMLGVLGVILGLALLLGGPRVAQITHPEPGKSRVAGVTILLSLTVLGGVAFYLAKSHLESLGYVFQR